MPSKYPSSWSEPPLLMIPGPTPVPRSVLEALARPTESHNSGATAAALKTIQKGVARAVGAAGDGPDGAVVFALAGSGTAALECAICNCLGVGEKVLVVKHGYFGDRFAAVARARGAEVTEVSCPWGEQVPASEVARALDSCGARVVLATHVDTATGVVSPLEEYGQVARERGVLFILDAVASAGGMPIGMEANSVDVVVTASQKAFAMPPGLALLVVGPKAMAKRRELPGAGSYFFDWLNWLPAMLDPVQKYFATTPTNMIMAGATAIDLAEEEGWEPRFARHRRMASSIRRGLLAVGLAPMAPDQILSTTVTALAVPAAVEVAALRSGVLEQGVVISAGIGDWGGRAIRIGHMGSSGLPELLRVVAAVELALVGLGVPVERGAAVAELLAGWELG